MGHIAINTALGLAGQRLLQALMNRAQDAFEETDDSIYLIVEAMARDIQIDDLQAALETAQTRFRAAGPAQVRWLDMIAEVLDNGGPTVPAFADNLWRAYIFRLSPATNALWEQYPALQRAVVLRSHREMASSWSDWLIPMRTFMGEFEEALINLHPNLERLLASPHALLLLEDDLAELAGSGPQRAWSSSGLNDDQVDALSTLNHFLLACSQRIGQIDPRGYPRSVNTTVPIDDIYIPLKLVPLESSNPSKLLRYSTATHQRGDLHANWHLPDWVELDRRGGLSLAQVVRNSRKTLILGASGAGKTTLLRSLALVTSRMLLEDQDAIQVTTESNGATQIRLAGHLPLYVDLALYVEDEEQDDLRTYILHSGAELAADDHVIQPLNILLDSGQCMILLDGLDQVATDEQRSRLLTEVTSLANEWAGQGNSVIVTSRLAGFGTPGLPSDFAVYLVRPLDRSQIGPFLIRWSTMLNRMQRPLMRDDEALRQAEVDMLAMVREIGQTPRAYNVLNSPLILRLLATVYRPGMTLPNQQAGVFQLVADTLIREWRLPQQTGRQANVLEHEATTLLGELATWLQAARPGGLLSESELRQIVTRTWGD
ncbi:MAG: hypothetical protein GYB68_14865, partial [Chloroflexi bacterium]|nr:hypothetical protein [Chloroflexota bacterium]